MKSQQFILFFLSILCLNFSCNEAKETEETTKVEELNVQQIQEDLDFLDQKLKQFSSYQGLNGYSYQTDFEKYKNDQDHLPTSKKDFQIFLTNVIGQIGDRHSYVKGVDFPRTKYLPFWVAPFEDKVVMLSRDQSKSQFKLYNPKYPFLTKINDIPISDFLKKILREEIKAPTKSFLNRAVQQLRDIGESYQMMGMEAPEELSFTFSGTQGDTTCVMQLASRKDRKKIWGDKFEAKDYREEEELNDSIWVNQLFHTDKNNIAYFRITEMARPSEAPLLFEKFNQFIHDNKAAKAFIFDLRDNTGGSRDFIFELAKYVIHPDSLHVVNVAKSKGENPLNEDYRGQLNRRFLFSSTGLDQQERDAVHQFMKTFKPMYDLPEEGFSEYFYTVFNGKKLSKENFYLDRPIYLLMNERVFSAASVFAATFKGLPNVKLVGVTSDGSSGNSEKFLLPNSKLKVKLSTMVSFQKDGIILDGFGTKPDIEIQRSLDQVLWKEDYQLEKLKELINSKD